MDTSTRGSCSASVLKEYLEALNVLKLPTLQILEEEDVDGGAFLLLTEDYLRLNFATIKSGERLKVLNLVEQFKLAPPHIFGESQSSSPSVSPVEIVFMESLETTDILETNEGVPMVSTSVKKTVKSAAPSKSSSSSPARKSWR
ncbi:uncharacterized protein LOC113205752 [Frankliniella occidentalis]|uniref:Uncharacterized protein LOC113205752 n=1 Tax=Frankliniella occidentalis TaxID=133901 RepID=A0A6J1SDA4_FRAOC|nr:uncharacterized protein LOC113205752 [Frankliniella occidentalis]XP_052133054.1 uncharacterized protein LOC113205752 [Frankliniella occidentalis]XP_052133055.1 uncharacterized protein LOC113205752 [Frankliniella occidentalis]